MEDNKYIYVTDKDGKKIESEIIFAFEANGDDFVLYEIEEIVYAAKMDYDGKLSPVEGDEWKLIEKMFNEFLEEKENGN